MRRSLVVVSVLLALAVAGCNGGDDDKPSSKADYGAQLATAGKTLQKAFADVANQTGPGLKSSQIADRLGQTADAVQDTAAKFDAITPPADARAAHQKLVDGLKELAATFRRGETAQRKHDSAALNESLQGLATSDGVRKIGEAEAELKAKGIEIAPTAGK